LWVEANISARMRGYRKKVGPVSNRKSPASLAPDNVAERPPTSRWRSNTVTAAPARARSMADARPPGPAPMMAMRRVFAFMTAQLSIKAVLSPGLLDKKRNRRKDVLF
jgi:hypothetical protein